MDTTRVEEFSDGVFTIAFTLLVLELKIPANVSQAGHIILHQWPSFVAFMVSSLLIGLIWANHHSFFVYLKTVDRPLLFINILLMTIVSFIPYPTSILAQALNTANPQSLRFAAMFYGAVLAISAIIFDLLKVYAVTHQTIIIDHKNEKVVFGSRLRFWLSPVGYTVGAIVAQWVPYVSLVLYVGLIAYYWTPPHSDKLIEPSM